MKVKSIKNHEASRQHKDSEFANRACKKSNEAPLEWSFMRMGKTQKGQMVASLRHTSSPPTYSFSNSHSWPKLTSVSYERGLEMLCRGHQKI